MLFERNAVLSGLSPNGKLMIIGASDEPLQVPVNQFLLGRQSVMGCYSGSSIYSDTLAFSALSGVLSMNEIFPLEAAEEAYEKMMNSKVRFRSILATGKNQAKGTSILALKIDILGVQNESYNFPENEKRPLMISILIVTFNRSGHLKDLLYTCKPHNQLFIHSK